MDFWVETCVCVVVANKGKGDDIMQFGFSFSRQNKSIILLTHISCCLFICWSFHGHAMNSIGICLDFWAWQFVFLLLCSQLAFTWRLQDHNPLFNSNFVCLRNASLLLAIIGLELQVFDLICKQLLMDFSSCLSCL